MNKQNCSTGHDKFVCAFNQGFDGASRAPNFEKEIESKRPPACTVYYDDPEKVCSAQAIAKICNDKIDSMIKEIQQDLKKECVEEFYESEKVKDNQLDHRSYFVIFNAGIGYK